MIGSSQPPPIPWTEPPDSSATLSPDRTMASLRDHKLTSIPSWLESLTSLTTLDLSENRLTTLAESLGKLTSLTRLDLSGNRLTTLPESLGNLTALTRLSLGHSLYLPGWLEFAPANVVHTTDEAVYDLETVRPLRRLISIEASGNRLTTLPKSLGKLTSLTTLDLSRNRLTTLPESLGKLTSLTTLDLSGNRLTTLPESLGKLTSLTRLDLSGNRLTTLPESLGKLTSLTTLDLSGNRLTTLPESLGKLTSLTMLDLSGNRLTTLPESLGKLTSLTTLNLSRNRLTTLPESLADLQADGLQLELADNPHEVTFVPSPSAWEGELLDRAWMTLHSLFGPSVSLAAVLAATDMSDPAAAVLQLYNWERDRLLTLAKGTAGAAITVLAGLIVTAVGGKIRASDTALFLAATLVAALLFWSGFLLTGLRRLAEEYATAQGLRKPE